MSPGCVAGQQIICFCVLIIMIVSIFTDKQHSPSLDVMLCAAVLLWSAMTMHFVSWAYGKAELDTLFYASRALSSVLTIAAGVAAMISFLLWKPLKPRAARWLGLLAALLPMWLAGLYWVMTRQAALLFSAITLSLLIIRSFYQRDMEQTLKKKMEEIEDHQAMVFQWQMQPHFIFNSLSTIRALIDSDPALASSGLENLAGYLRKNIDALTQETLIPFARELEHIEQYVALEKMNPTNRFDVVYDLQIINFCLPALSVQPLVENAICHGVRSLGEEGMIFITTEQHGEMIRIIVEDNGPGFPASTTPQQQERISHGLANVRRRLKSQCDGSLHIHSDENGTRVIVLLPKSA